MTHTMTAQHTWVKHVITPVSVLPSDSGEPVVFVDPDDQAIAEDNAAYGCDACGRSMAQAINDPCDGGED